MADLNKSLDDQTKRGNRVEALEEEARAFKDELSAQSAILEAERKHVSKLRHELESAQLESTSRTWQP